MKSPRGFTLVELLATIPLIVMILAISIALFPELVRDTPRAFEAVRSVGVCRPLLMQIQRDVDSAVALPATHENLSADPNNLLVQLPDKLIHYTVADGKIYRREFTGGDKNKFVDEQIWTLAPAKVAFRLFPQDSPAGAVEVFTAAELPRMEGSELKLANNHVFFLHSLSGRVLP